MPAVSLRAAIPNLLTISRLLLAVLFFILLSVVDLAADHRPALVAAAALFTIAALTDALDGFLARRWKVVSRFGRVMDPFADKLLVLGAFVLLAGPRFSISGEQVTGVAPWMAVAILARELLVTSLRGVLESSGVDFSATASGKIKMFAQSCAVPGILLLIAFNAPAEVGAWRSINLAIAWAVVIITAWSGLPYITRAIHAFRENKGTP